MDSEKEEGFGLGTRKAKNSRLRFEEEQGRKFNEFAVDKNPSFTPTDRVLAVGPVILTSGFCRTNILILLR